MSNPRPDATGSSGSLKVPGLGTLSKQLLAEQGVRTMADLARTDPYDPRFRMLGEPFSSWVLYARAVIADEIITGAEVTPSAILVSCMKTYDKTVAKNSLMGRLGIYDVYVNVELREKPEAYEVLFRLKPEQMKFGMAQWMEYRNNAIQLKAAIRMKTGIVLSEAPIVAPRWPLDSFEEELRERTKEMEGLALLTRIYFRLISADRLNVIVLWDREAFNRSLARSFLEEFTPASAHVLCGGNTPEEVQEQIVLNGNEGVVIVDDFERVTPEEKRILLDLLATRRTKITYDGKRTEVNVKAKFVFNLWMPDRTDSPILDPDFMGLVDLAVRMTPAANKEALDEALESALPEVQEAKSALQSTTASEVLETDSPSEMKARLRKFKPPRYLLGYGARLDNSLRELSLGRARQRRSTLVEMEDFEEALELIELSNGTLSVRQRKAQHSV